jgi:hypothetical protein
VSDPYRDELMALREENARLRRIVGRRRARGAVLVLPAAAALTFVALQGIRPLLNAESDGRFFLGVFCAAIVLAADLACLFAVVRRDEPDAHA